MMNPPHPGGLLRDEIKALNLTVAEAAEGLGVTRQQLYNVLNGKSRISPDMAVRLEQGIGSTAETWLRMQSAYDLSRAREYAKNIHIERLEEKTAPISPR